MKSFFLLMGLLGLAGASLGQSTPREELKNSPKAETLPTTPVRQPESPDNPASVGQTVPAEVKEVAKPKSQAKPEKVVHGSARGASPSNRPSAHRRGGGGRPAGAGRPGRIR